MTDDLLRAISLVVWTTAFFAFLPGAIRAVRGESSAIAVVSLAACFSFLNRVMFSATTLFAPDLVIVSQAVGVIAGAWFAYIGWKVLWNGR